MAIQFGFIGLGRTEMNVERLLCDGHEIVASDIDDAKNPKLE
jgi:6-phosphogluconate dehydrogenase (decarboxylating)